MYINKLINEDKNKCIKGVKSSPKLLMDDTCFVKTGYQIKLR